MMKYLLDTHTILFWMTESPELPEKIRLLMGNNREEVGLSILSAWEISIKSSLGKLKGVPLDHLKEDLESQGFPIVPFTLDYIQVLGSLPAYHQDPFDRGLIATALKEDLILLSRDRQFEGYQVKTLW